ncbi:Yip1 family protein [Lysobacter sp. A03]|uniref:Yip1 family protein n=1 Tax=Lysobacter sp. A03 TaxID=1199154 RepID=UPI0005B734E8|nr:Yip1 family protein [Lysobacter sp. A03]KIQ98135.1 putative membrane protein [Lysobacter sp. A03]
MNHEGLISRVKSILFDPRRTWPLIGEEPATVAGLYSRYIMILAALPAIFTFIKTSLIGSGMFGVTVRTGIVAGLFGAVLTYALSLVLVYVVALIVNALAPSFRGQKNQVQALKTIAYAYTAAWVAGIGVIIPWLGGIIGLVGGIYSIYLLYLGLSHTMKNPPEKSLGYTVVIVVITLVLSLLIGVVVAGVTGIGAMGAGALGNSSNSSSVVFDKDSKLGQLAVFGEQMKAAGERMEAAESRSRGKAGSDSKDSGSSGSSRDADMASAEAAMAALFGGKDGEPLEALEPEQLKSLLPASVAGMQRTGTSANRESGMGMQISNASADYASDDGKQRIKLSLSDAPMMAKLGAFRGLVSSESSSETQDGFEKTYTRNGRQIEEKWNSRSGRGTYGVMVGSRFTVKAEGTAESFQQIQSAVESIDLTKLEAVAKAGAEQH